LQKNICFANRGNIKDNGSSGSPFSTIKRAVLEATTGDAIYFKGGIFRKTVLIIKYNITVTTDNKNIFITKTDCLKDRKLNNFTPL